MFNKCIKFIGQNCFVCHSHWYFSLSTMKISAPGFRKMALLMRWTADPLLSVCDKNPSAPQGRLSSEELGWAWGRGRPQEVFQERTMEPCTPSAKLSERQQPLVPHTACGSDYIISPLPHLHSFSVTKWRCEYLAKASTSQASDCYPFHVLPFHL